MDKKIIKTVIQRLELWLLVVVMLLICAVGCKDIQNGSEVVRASFQTAHVRLQVGDYCVNPVMNASVVELVSAPDCVEVAVEGDAIAIKGITAGEGEIWVMADARRIKCRVTVIDVSAPGTGEEPEDDIVGQLADSSMRVALGNQTISYASSGNLFMLSADMKRLWVVSLSTGDEVVFESDLNLRPISMSEEEMPMEIESASLTVNGVGKPLKSAHLMRNNGNCLWIRMVIKPSVAVWIIIPQGLGD